jgi:hypothetical protein
MGGAAAGMGGVPTSAAGETGSAGTFTNGGKGGSYGCVGLACGGTGAGSGGRYETPCTDPNSPFCTPCNGKDDCPDDFSCGPYNYCRPTCSPTFGCNDYICDAITSTCVPCVSDPQCEALGNSRRNVCEAGRCVECNERAPCDQGRMCVLSQCVECTNDKDCASGRCDKIRGRCINGP